MAIAGIEQVRPVAVAVGDDSVKTATRAGWASGAVLLFSTCLVAVAASVRPVVSLAPLAQSPFSTHHHFGLPAGWPAVDRNS